MYEKEPESVVKVTTEGDLNIMVNDDNEAEHDLKNYAVWGECYSDFVANSIMVRPGTRLVKNHESQSRIIESQFKKQWVPGSFVTTHLIWRQTPKLCITVYWNVNIPLLSKSTTKTKSNIPRWPTAARRDAGCKGNKITDVMGLGGQQPPWSA